MGTDRAVSPLSFTTEATWDKTAPKNLPPSPTASSERFPTSPPPPSLSRDARSASISRATLYRWLQDDQFRQALDRLQSEAADFARSALQRRMLKGILELHSSSLCADRSSYFMQGNQNLPEGVESECFVICDVVLFTEATNDLLRFL